MTFGQMRDLFNQRIDQSGSPDFNATEADRLLNFGYDIWYIINRKKFDTDQANSVNMTHLIRKFTFPNVKIITVVGALTNIPDYRDLSTMTATFNFTDCNGNVSLGTRNVTPMPLSALDTNQFSDPYNKPTNEYPMYIQSHGTNTREIEVFSDTIPLFLSGRYFKELQVIDAKNNPNAQFEAQDYVARQVVDIAKILAKGDVDDYPAVKNAIQETSMSMA